MSLGRRLLLLLVLLVLGLLAGVLGWQLTGSQAWFLCVPAAVAAGWLAVADPTRCQRRPSDP